MRKTRAVAPLLALIALLFSSVAGAQCTKDIECKGDRVCTDGVCAPPGAAAPSGVSPTASVPVAAPAKALPAAPPAGPTLNEPAPDAPVGYRRRTGLMVTGIVMASVGVGALIGALTLGVLKSTCRRDLDEKYPDRVVDAAGLAEVESCKSYDDPLLMLTAGGLVLTGAGLPMLIVGAKKIPVYQARVSPWLTPRSGGLILQLSL